MTNGKTKKAVSLLSGGLDSLIATWLAARKYEIALAVTFDYGQRAARKEIKIARNFCKIFKIEHVVIKLPWLKKTTQTALVKRGLKIPLTTPGNIDKSAEDRAKSVWVPNRNGVLIAIAAAIAESRNYEAVVAGFNLEEARTFSDNSKSFIDAANSALKYSTLSSVKVISPTLGLKKDKIAAHFVSSKIDPKLFWCCYEGKAKLCGRCESCARTIRAFKKIGEWNLIKERFI